MKTILMILLILTLSISAFGQEHESIALELKEELQLSDDQADQVSGLIEKFANELNAVMQKHETEKSDPQSFLHDIKTVRE